jgi:hypothetical protein
LHVLLLNVELYNVEHGNAKAIFTTTYRSIPKDVQVGQFLDPGQHHIGLAGGENALNLARSQVHDGRVE